MTDPHAAIEQDIRRLDAERRAAYVEHEQQWVPCSCWPNHQDFCEHCHNRGGWWERLEVRDDG